MFSLTKRRSAIWRLDSDGSRTETVELEYKYDPATGIGSIEATAKAGLHFSGRTLGMTDGSLFSVYTPDGQQLVAGVDGYTFAAQGVYLVRTGKTTVKVSVR